MSDSLAAGAECAAGAAPLTPTPLPSGARGFSVLLLEHAAKRAFPFLPGRLRLEKEEARDACRIRSLLMLNAQLTLSPHPNPSPLGGEGLTCSLARRELFSLLPAGEKGRG